MFDHVHMPIYVPSKYGVLQAVAYIEGKSAIWIAWNYFGRDRNFVVQHFWAHDYYVSMVGGDKKVIAEYIENRGERDIGEDQ